MDLLVEFARTGRIGPLHCGMWLSEADLTLALNAAGARHELQPLSIPRQRLLHIEPGGVAASFAAMADGRFYLLVMHKSTHLGAVARPEIMVGETYRVHLPNRSDAGRFLTDPNLLMWVLGEAEDFELTVESTGARLNGEPAVIGVRFKDTVHVSTPLPPDAASHLGLPSDVEYLVRGVLVDALSGQVVQLPTEETLTIPVEWLRPLG